MPDPASPSLSKDLIEALTRIVGPAHALTDPDQQLRYTREWRDLYKGRTPLVLRPGRVEEVAEILRLANAHRIPIVPQAGNTGLVGGQVPFEDGVEIVLSVERMNRVRALDPAGTAITVEAGMTLAEVRAAADAAGRLFPLSLPSEGSCRIGGNLATNAGGVGVLAYGNARQQVLGIEAVLADGRILDLLSSLKKDNTGYDLKNLIIGSEGTLAVITAAVLRLLPRPAEKATAFVALGSLDRCLALFRSAEARLGASLTAFEFLPRIVMDFALRHLPGARDPFSAPHPWYVLIEVSGALPDGEARRRLELLLDHALEVAIVDDAVAAESLAQARDLWRVREGVSEAQKPEGGSIKHDISVPVSAIPDFVTRADALVIAMIPGARPLAFGHMGDGNVHYNVAQPVGADRHAFLAHAEDVQRAVHDLVAGMGGSISAEHGIGRMKRGELARFKSPVALDLMRGIKTVFDPNGVLNPGKVL